MKVFSIGHRENETVQQREERKQRIFKVADDYLLTPISLVFNCALFGLSAGVFFYLAITGIKLAL